MVYFPVFIFLLLICSCKSEDQLTHERPLSPGDILVSSNGVFALGFFPPVSSNTSLYVGIWFHNLSDSDSSRTLVWVANRDSPATSASSTSTWSSRPRSWRCSSWRKRRPCTSSCRGTPPRSRRSFFPDKHRHRRNLHVRQGREMVSGGAATSRKKPRWRGMASDPRRISWRLAPPLPPAAAGELDRSLDVTV